MTRAPLAALLLLAPAAHAGHSRHPYFDGGQSADGRFTVTVKRVGGELVNNKPAPHHWEYTWTDTKTRDTLTGKLDAAYRVGGHFGQLCAHTFVAPDGQTFAAWNPQSLAALPPAAKRPDAAAPEYRTYPGLADRLVVFKKSGEVVKRLAVGDVLREDEWKQLAFYGEQVYWLSEYDKLTTKSAPRPMYALYRVSPDYSVLEFRVGVCVDSVYSVFPEKLKDRNFVVPKPRTVRVDLTTGALLPVGDDAAADKNKVPVRPFVGPDTARNQDAYVPPLDPVRQPGRFEPPKPE